MVSRVSLVTNVLQRPDTQAVIYPRMERILQFTRALGCETDVDRAALCGLSPRHWSRLSSRPAGAVVIAKVITALRRYEQELAVHGLRPAFDELFEVVVEPISGRPS